MIEYIIRVVDTMDRPVRIKMQTVVTAGTQFGAEQKACEMAVMLYGGHVENYDAQAIPLIFWNSNKMSFLGHFA